MSSGVPSSGGSIPPPPPHIEKEESSFARWKKRFTTKSKPKVPEIAATPAAVTILHVAAIYRSASQRTFMRALRRWKTNVERMKAAEAMKSGGLSVSVPPNASGIGIGLASVYGSPLSRPRGASNAAASVPGASTATLPTDATETTAGAIPIPARSGTANSSVAIPSAAYSTSPSVGSPRMASLSMSSGSPIPSSSLGTAANPRSQSVQMPHRTLGDSSLVPVKDDNPVSASASPGTTTSTQAENKHLAFASPWTSARPVRPSIIAHRKAGYATLPASSGQAGGGIHPSLMSPTLAFRKSIIVRDRGTNASTAAGTTSPNTPLSPARLVPLSGSPPLRPPHAMQSHPRGSVMLGDIKEWRSANDLLGEGDEDDTSGSDNESGVGSRKGSSAGVKGVRFDDRPQSVGAIPLSDSSTTVPPLLRRHSVVLARWRGAIRQIMALAMWAKKRTSSRHSLSVPAHLRELAREELQRLDEEHDHESHPDETTDSRHSPDGASSDDEHPSIAPPTIHSQPPSAVSSPTNAGTANTAAITKVVSPADTPTTPAPTLPRGLQPKSTLLDYFFVCSLPPAALEPTLKQLRQIEHQAHGLTTRKALESIVAESNAALAKSNAQAETLCRYPLTDRLGFPADPHWSAFGFPDGARISLTPRVTQCFSSVMTLADGLALFATYLKFDVPLMPHLPHAFSHGHPHHTSTSTSPSTTTAATTQPAVSALTSPTGEVKFWDESSTTAAAPNHDHKLQRSWSSPSSAASPVHGHGQTNALHPQLYAPQCLILISHYPCMDVMRAIAQMLFEVACLGGRSEHEQQLQAISTKQKDSKNSHTSVAAPTTLESLLRSLCFEIPVPIPKKYAIRFRIHRALLTVHFPGLRNPSQSMLNLDLLFRTLNVDNVIGVLAAMLTEHRLLFHSTSLNLLTHCMQCLVQLLYPFNWWYSYVPQLTEDMLDAHEIPQPYMLGIHSSHLSQLQALDSVLIVDLDHDVLRCSTPLTPLPIKDGRELWLSWRKSFEKIQITRLDQVEDVRTVESHPPHHTTPSPSPANASTDPCIPGSSFATAALAGLSSAIGNNLTMSSNMRRGSFSMSALPLPATTAAPAANAIHHPPAPANTATTPIATMLPSSCFNFDEEIYAALLRFYADLLQGSKKFLFFITGVPFFNAQGFLSQKVSREPDSFAFMQAFVASRAFDVYIEEESNVNDPYHDYLATGTPVNRVQQILLEDFGRAEKFLEIPTSSDGGDSNRVEARVHNFGEEEVVIAAVQMDAPIPAVSSVHAAATDSPTRPLFDPSVPFSFGMFSTSTTHIPLPTNRQVWWSGLDQDRAYYEGRSFAPQPRKPKTMDNATGPPSGSSSDGAYGIGEVFSPAREGGDIPMVPGFADSQRNATGSHGKDLAASTTGQQSTGSKIATGKSKQSKETTGEHKLKQYLSQIFSSQVLTKDEMRDFVALLGDSTCRRTFATILSQPKSNGGGNGASGSHGPSSSGGGSSSLCLTQAGFEQLSNLVKTLLDSCLQSKDFVSASLGALDVGNVYYKEDSTRGHTRTYLESSMKKHPLWQQMEFWRANLTLSLSQRAIKPNSGNEDEFILQWMIATSHQMTAYAVPHKEIERLMTELAQQHQLKQESRTTIISFLGKIKEAAQYW